MSSGGEREKEEKRKENLFPTCGGKKCPFARRSLERCSSCLQKISREGEGMSIFQWRVKRERERERGEGEERREREKREDVQRGHSKHPFFLSFTTFATLSTTWDAIPYDCAYFSREEP
jgi:hypothetical protein